MKIYSLLLVKNEADIIASVLESAVKWSDKIIVFDNGSSDGSWQIINELSELYPNIIPFTTDDRPFRIGLRAIMFDAFKRELSSDDWWCVRMDADEFYIDDPREFLSNVPKRFGQVSKASIDYKITKEDLAEFNYSGDFVEDRDKIRYYEPQTWSETRFIRHSNRLKWEIDERKPQPCGMTCPIQIRVAHYQFRSPQQMQMRSAVRQKALENSCGSFRHERGKQWEDYLSERNRLVFDRQDGIYPTDGNRNKVRRWHTEFFKSILTFLRYY